MRRFLAWIVPALNPAEREDLLAILPPPAQAMVASLATA
jgi:hypothetical protein